MSDVYAAQDIPHDGTISGAIDSMPDIDELERQNGDRDGALRDDDSGKFKAREDEGGEPEPDADEAPEPDKAADDAAEEDDEDYFEIAAEEEGAEPTRLKATEVLEGYNRAKQLESELENVRATTPPPPDYDRATIEAVEIGQQYLQQLSQVEQMLQPFEPNQELINPNSPNYDPEMYFSQQQQASAMKEQLAQVQTERTRVKTETQQRQEAVQRAQFAREQHKLMEAWPELKEEATQNQVREFVSKKYGIDQETLNSVHDSRFYALVKDAMAHDAQSAAKETAVKVVKAKPKLVKGKARSTNPANRKSEEGMRRLQQSGSLDDAFEALGDLD